MTHYLRHQYQLLQLSLKIVGFSIEKETWAEINDEVNMKIYQEKINDLEYQKELYLNNLLRSLHKTEINEYNAVEIKKTYDLIEQYSSSLHSQLFKAHLNRTIEKHQKKYGDCILRNQLKKAYEIEKKISELERVA